ncbi:hypothetical protein LJC48_04695 [Desulfovibrio sp. OttesenSCG-928-C06]|nr:hypothetical protein [Desulfovibrio sp. OttesenSCG-928-C06]
METDLRALSDKIFPQDWPSCYRHRCKLSPIRKRRGGMWNLHPFETLSPRKRANAVIKLRNKIRMQSPACSHRFWGGRELLDQDRPWHYQQDTRVLFCGTDKRVYWNAYIQTAKRVFWDKVSDLARERAKDMLSAEELEQSGVFKFISTESDAWGYPKLFALEEHTHIYPQFGGLTLSEYEKTLELEIIASSPPDVYESFEIDRNFESGIGLYVVVDAEYLTLDTVECIIDRFIEVGEKNWASGTPVPRDRLPREMQMDF